MPASTWIPPCPCQPVIQHGLSGIVEEMGEAMLRTPFSQILNSSRDFSTAICGADGALVAQAEHIPVHVGALATGTRAIYRVNAFPRKRTSTTPRIAFGPRVGQKALTLETLVVRFFGRRSSWCGGECAGFRANPRLWVRAHVQILRARGYSPGVKLHCLLRAPAPS